MENPLKMVRDTIAESTGIRADSILTSSKIRSLAMDSLEYQGILVDLADVTGVDADDIDRLGTVGALVARMHGSRSHA